MSIHHRIAIIGASISQYPLCLKAREMGLETYCFAWAKSAVCRDVVDHFYDISITEVEKIAAICKEVRVEGVLSNGSDFPSEQAAAICDLLGFNTTPYDVLVACRNKYYVRELCKDILSLTPIRAYKYEGVDENLYPAVVKPVKGGAKSGVCFAKNQGDFVDAIRYAQTATDGDIIIEEYIEGKEVSVESISYKGQHTILQITDKQSSAAPHFVELGHHQPAQLQEIVRAKIYEAIPEILTRIGFTNGPSHIELKYNDRGDVFLIEANLRGGGDMISGRLVEMSTGADYLRYMIDVAMGTFENVKFGMSRYAGVYYLCSQTKEYLPFFKSAEGKPWLIEKEIVSEDLKESLGNYERNGYLLYCSDDHKVLPTE